MYLQIDSIAATKLYCKMIIRAENVKDLIITYQEVGGFSVVGDLPNTDIRENF